MRKRALVLGFASLMAVGSSFAGDEDLVKYRKNLMEIIGGHMGSIAAIVKSEVPHKGDLAYHAKGLAEAAPLVNHSFETKAMSDKSEALPKIWEDWAAFETASKKLEDASADLSAAISSGDMGAMGGALSAVGKSCKGCHDDFVEDH